MAKIVKNGPATGVGTMANRKKSWRKIDVSAELDAQENEELRQRVGQLSDFITLDTAGRGSGRSGGNGADEWEATVSPSHLKLVDRTRRALSKKPEKKPKGPFDLWGDEIVESAGRKRSAPSGGAKRTLAPALKRPHPGQSVNPDRESHLEFLEAEAAKILEEERVETEKQKESSPLSKQLEGIVPKRQIRGMTLPEKQRAVRRLSIGGVEAIPEIGAIGAPLPDEAEEDNSDGEEMGGEEAINRKQPLKKSKGTRNRQRRHAERLEKTRQKRLQRQFLHSVLHAKPILKELSKKEANLEQKLAYKRLLKEQLQEAEKEGDVRLKTGKNTFRDNPELMNTTSDLKKSKGSLRALRIPQGMSSVVDKLKSMERRGLVELLSGRSPDLHRLDNERKRMIYKRQKYRHPLMREAEREAAQKVFQSQGGRILL